MKLKNSSIDVKRSFEIKITESSYKRTQIKRKIKFLSEVKFNWQSNTRSWTPNRMSRTTQFGDVRVLTTATGNSWRHKPVVSNMILSGELKSSQGNRNNVTFTGLTLSGPLLHGL